MDGRGPTDWKDFAERLLSGDDVAFFELVRMIHRILGRARASDFEQDWDDIVQEVALKTVEQLQGEGLRDPQQFPGFVKQVTRRKFFDRLRRSRSRRERNTEPWEGVVNQEALTAPAGAEDVASVRELLGKLPEPQGEILFVTCVLKRTLEQASGDLGIPLGTLKKQASIGKATLRKRLEAMRER